MKHRTDTDRLNWLEGEHNSLFINHNDHHTNYITAGQEISDDPDSYDESQDVLQEMITKDSIWRIQVYPNTPVGFYRHHASTLRGAIDAAMEDSDVE